MKVLSDLTTSHSAPPQLPAANNFELPLGIIGFKDYTRAELLYVPDHLPFLWMKLHRGAESVHFIVIEPGGLVPDYTPELFDADAAALEINDPTEAMLLNIVTLRQHNPLDATINLIGPVVVNRRTRIGRQLVIANYSRYNAHWPLVDHSPVLAGRATA